VFTLTVLVPAFNEEKTISESLDRLRKHDIFDKILVLNDGSTDQTVEIVKKIAKDDNRTTEKVQFFKILNLIFFQIMLLSMMRI